MTSSRDTVFASVRRALGVTSREAPRRQEVEARLGGHPAGLVPARAQMPAAKDDGATVRVVGAAALESRL